MHLQALNTERYPFEGPDALRGPVEAALRSVVDPEVALNIVDVGLVVGVRCAQARVDIEVTMTSAACPASEVIVADIEEALDARLPAGWRIHVERVWAPAWSPERMSPRAKLFMGW